jgi:aspartyl-tRNA(Asn)/glutamyl-tRNA(Gln) amidotransferase subunit B
MEKGSMRMEPNISVKASDSHESTIGRIDPKDFPTYKVEVKNINSFNFVKKAVDYEIKRHIELLQKGEVPTQETRGWDDVHSRTYSQRTKENSADYRYFPDPDIPPMVFDEKELEKMRSELPELPYQKVVRYAKQLKIKIPDAIGLTRESNTSNYFEQLLEIVRKTNVKIDPQQLANMYINKKVDVALDPDTFVHRALELSKPKETNQELLGQVVAQVLKSNMKSVDDYKSGKTNAVMYLVGQVMKEMKGQADAAIVKESILKNLQS